MRCERFFAGHLHTDGYAGFAELYESAEGKPANVTEVACWAHVRRKFFDVHKANGSPIAREALERIGALFEIERTIAGKSAEQRRAVRQGLAKDQLDKLAEWLDQQLKLLSGKSELAGAIRYARSRWDALTAYIDDGRLEVSNNAAENAIRPVTLGRKNWLFAGSHAGGDRGRGVLHADPVGQAQRPRARGLAARCSHTHRRASNQPDRQAVALEHGATGDAKRRRLNRQPSS